MRPLRDIKDIVRDYPLAPDENDLRRLCHAHLERLQQAEDITDWIDREPNPYLRELYATYTTLLIKEYCADGTLNNVYGTWEPIFEELNHIARRAFGSQIGDNLYHAEKIAYSQPQQEAVAQAIPYYQKLEKQIAYLNNRMDKMEQHLSQPNESVQWSYIVPNDIKTIDEVEADLLAAARKDAPTLARYIKKATKIGYIDLRGDSIRTIFDSLKAHFHLPYEYDNFRIAYSRQ